MNRRHFLSSLLGLSGAALCPELLLDLLKPRKTMIVVPEWKPTTAVLPPKNICWFNKGEVPPKYSHLQKFNFAFRWTGQPEQQLVGIDMDEVGRINEIERWREFRLAQTKA